MYNLELFSENDQRNHNYDNLQFFMNSCRNYNLQNNILNLYIIFFILKTKQTFNAALQGHKTLHILSFVVYILN